MSDIKEQRSKRFAQLIGYELKANFAREGTSQAEVAERLGHSKSGYSRWINAKPSMPLEAFINTCELINVDPRQVVDAAYTRLIEELGAPPTIAQVADDIASNPGLYDLAANRDDNKELEAETPRD